MRKSVYLAVNLISLLALLVACAPAAPTVEPTKPSAPAAAPTAAPKAPTAATAAPAAKPKDIPRNRSLRIIFGGGGTMEGKHVDHELWNPYSIGSNHQSGSGIFYEPVAYYSAFADKEVLWLAESYKYSSDFKELTIKTRSGIKWSDGAPFSAEDVAYTINSLRDLGSKVKWGVDVQQVVEEAKATDPNTVVIKFKVPSPRFFWFMTYKYDIGIYIVPKHIFQSQDWTTFKHFDLAKDWPVTTSPWKVVFVSPEQKIVDRRDEWWAAKAGLAPLPKVERIVILPFAGEQQLAQALITNEVDYTWSLQPSTFPTVLSQNPKIITHTGQKPPYGYVDWFPLSLYVNNEKPPFNDKDIRWAISYFIDRQQIVDVAWAGASSLYPLPVPSYPALKPYVDATKPLLERYNTLEFNPKKGEELLTKKGWKKNAAGIWEDSQGKTFKLDMTIRSVYAQVAPVVVEQLKRQGFDVSLSMPPDAMDRFTKGEYVVAMYGHGGSVRDPYDTLRLYQSKTTAVPGLHLVNFSKWTNEAYDKIVDELYGTDMNDKAKLVELWKKAMEIWLPELPDIQLTESHHRIPMNTTYWKGWPTAEDPYVNGAFWHLTFGMILPRLEPVQ